MSEKVPMTAPGFARLEEELRHLKNVARPEVIRAIAEAREHGDLSENAEYEAAKKEGKTAALLEEIAIAQDDVLVGGIVEDDLEGEGAEALEALQAQGQAGVRLRGIPGCGGEGRPAEGCVGGGFPGRSGQLEAGTADPLVLVVGLEGGGCGAVECLKSRGGDPDLSAFVIKTDPRGLPTGTHEGRAAHECCDEETENRRSGSHVFRGGGPTLGHSPLISHRSFGGFALGGSYLRFIDYLPLLVSRPAVAARQGSAIA